MLSRDKDVPFTVSVVKRFANQTKSLLGFTKKKSYILSFVSSEFDLLTPPYTKESYSLLNIYMLSLTIASYYITLNEMICSFLEVKRKYQLYKYK
jgi:hypothetical protein